MLPKRKRLTKALYKELVMEGKYRSGKVLSVRVRRKPDEQSRFAFSVSKKVNPAAAARNRIRRRGYAALTRFYPQCPKGVQAIYTLVLRGREPSMEELFGEIERLLSS